MCPEKMPVTGCRARPGKFASGAARTLRSTRRGRRELLALLLGAATCTAPTHAAAAPDHPALALVQRTLGAMSAGRDVARLSSIALDAREITEDLVENDHPMTAPFYTSAIDDIRRIWDYDHLVEATERSDGGQKSTLFFSSSLAVSLSTVGSARPRTVGTPPPAWTTRDPIGALRLAVSAPDLATEPDVIWHGSRQHVVAFHDGRYPVRIFIDAGTGLPSATEAVVAFDDQRAAEAIAWNALGDVIERTEYMNWSFVDGIRYPFQQDELRDGQRIRSLTVRAARMNVPLDASPLRPAPGQAFAPRSVQDLRPSDSVPGGPYPNKPVVEIAPGIVQIPNSWYATIVRQDDGLVIIDAPISAGYSKGVLEEAAKRFPGLRVKALVTSTGFFWHVAGVREYAARGIPVYAEARNVPVIERMLRAPHRLVPDNLSRVKNPRPHVIAVNNAVTIGSGPNAIRVYPVSSATQPMLMSYIPDARLLHTGEMVQPLGPGGSFLFPESLIELTNEVGMRRLLVDRIIGMHMSPTPWTAVADAIKSAASATPAP